MRRLPSSVALLAAALLTVPAPATAKEIGRALACGKAGCRDVTGRLPKGDGEAEQLLGTGSLGAGRPPAHPYLVMRLKMRIPGQGLAGGWRFVLVPALGMVRYEVEGEFHWGTLPPDQAAAMRRIVRGVPRWPASRMPKDPPPATAEHVSVASRPGARTGASERASSLPAVVVLGAGALAALALALAVRRRHGLVRRPQ